MKRSRTEIKATLLSEIEAELDEALEWQEKAERPNLTAFENKVLSIRKSIGIRVLKEILKDEDSELSIEQSCPHCATLMESKGKHRQVIETRLGTLELEREYFYCQTCQTGLFPPLSPIASL